MAVLMHVWEEGFGKNSGTRQVVKRSMGDQGGENCFSEGIKYAWGNTEPTERPGPAICELLLPCPLCRRFLPVHSMHTSECTFT